MFLFTIQKCAASRSMKKNVEKWANDPQYSKIKFYQGIVDDMIWSISLVSEDISKF